MEKWIVTLDSEPCAIGPFKSYEDARTYIDSDPEADNMRTMQLFTPARGWRKDNPMNMTEDTYYWRVSGKGGRKLDEGGPYATRDEAIIAARDNVREWHPTARQISTSRAYGMDIHWHEMRVV
jgi:hypothetical protein